MPDFRAEQERLLKRFENALSQRETSSDYFDEDELLDIFDYAGDMGNNYIRLEALLWGNRFFPESERLRERKGVLYGDVFSREDLNRYTSGCNDEQASTLNSLLDLRANAEDSEKTRLQLIKILRQSNKLGDEEVIQLVNVAEDAGLVGWLWSVSDKLREKVEYQPVLLFELGSAMLDAKMAEVAVPLLEELTAADPYNADYWALYADALYESDCFNEALEATDMALAIDPDHPRANEVKAIEWYFKSDKQKLAQLFSKFNQSNEIATRYFKLLLADNDKKISAAHASSLLKLAKQYPNNDVLLCSVWQFCRYNANAFFESLWMAEFPVFGAGALQTCLDRAGMFASQKIYDAAWLLVEIAYKAVSYDQEFTAVLMPAFAMLAYRNGEYKKCLAAVNKYHDYEGAYTSELIMVRILSSLRLHKFEMAEQFIDEVLDKNSDIEYVSTATWHTGERLARIALHMILPHIKESIHGKTNLTQEEWDDLSKIDL